MSNLIHRLNLIEQLLEDKSEASCYSRVNFLINKSEKNEEFFKQLLPSYQIIHLEYSVLCTQIIRGAANEKINDEQLVQQAIDALMLAQVLIHLYKDYLAVPREVERLIKDKELFIKLLEIKIDSSFQNVLLPDDTRIPLIREVTRHANMPRLLLVRLKGALKIGADSLQSFERSGHFIKWLNKHFNNHTPVFSYMAWTFFIPRLGTNLFILSKHTISNRWMSEQERSLDWSLRLKLHFQRRWFDVANDIAAMSIGLANCFLFAGIASSIFYMTLVLYTYDIVLAVLRAAIEINHLNNLHKETEKLFGEKQIEGAPSKELAKIESFLQSLNERIDYETKRLRVAVVSTNILLIALLLTAPTAALISPLIPIVGGLALILTTLVAFVALNLIEKQKPQDNIQQLSTKDYSRFTLFKTLNAKAAELQQLGHIQTNSARQESVGEIPETADLSSILLGSTG